VSAALAGPSTARIPAEVEAYRADFERRLAAGAEPAWFSALRGQAWDAFAEGGFPRPDDEDWRFTSVAPLARTRFTFTEAAGDRPSAELLGELSFGAPVALRVIVVNGRFDEAASNRPATPGLEVMSLSRALQADPGMLRELLGAVAPVAERPFTALNTALFADGVLVRVAAGAVVSEPLHVVHYAAGGDTPAQCHPRVLVVAGRGAQLTLVESYGGSEGAPYLTNAVTEIVLEDGAVVDHYRIQREAPAAFHVATTAVRQGRGTSFTSTAIELGGALARRDVEQVFAGEGGECTLNGLFLGGGTQHLDTHTRIDHARPHCTSRELYHGVLDGRARGVFVGRILVRAGAQKTDAQQSNKNLLLSPDALVHSLPQLEILTDDVKCKHGSTTGQLDPLALFYLRSRGLDAAEARSMLVRAFARAVVARVRPAALREGLEQHLEARLRVPERGADR
jgi:Fe-S cluster assembly protein SufD